MAEPYSFEPERVGCAYAISWHGRHKSDATLNNVLKHGDYRKTSKTKIKTKFYVHQPLNTQISRKTLVSR